MLFSSGKTALIFAAEKGYLSVAKKLFEVGDANLFKQDKQ
jgi:hypothetical protein